MMRLSIVVPVYKAEKYIEECLNSILPQLSQDDELILVDDGSPDRSGAICDTIAAVNRNVAVIHQPNGGVSKARNAGMARAQGEFLMFVDSDDALMGNAIETLRPFLADNSWDLLVYGNKRVQDSGITENNPSVTELLDRESFSRQYGNLCASFIVSSVWNKIYKTDMLQENDIFFDETLSLGEDLLFNNAVLRVSKSIQTVSKAIYLYYERETESLTRRYYPDLFEIYQRLYNDSMDTLLSMGGGDAGEIKALYYRQLKDGICNIWSDRTLAKSKQKMRQTKAAVKSREVKECLPSAEKKNILWYLICFEAAGLIRLYVSASRWKGRISNGKKKGCNRLFAG